MPSVLCFILLNHIPFPDLLGNTLTSDDLGQVLEAVMDVAAHWYPLGLQLNVTTGTLDRIRKQFSDPRDQLMEMLKDWLNTDDDPQWRTLINALRSRSVDARRLAGNLEREYCLVEGTEVDRVISASDSWLETYVIPHSPVSLVRPLPTTSGRHATE